MDPGSAEQHCTASGTRVQMKNGAAGPRSNSRRRGILLDLGFLELDVLARDRVVFLLAKPVPTFAEYALTPKEAVFRPRQTKILPQRAALIFAPENPASLQFRHHLVDEVVKPL